MLDRSRNIHFLGCLVPFRVGAKLPLFSRRLPVQIIRAGSAHLKYSVGTRRLCGMRGPYLDFAAYVARIIIFQSMFKR